MLKRKPFALIPARGGSKRLPRKNIVLLGGRPLLDWTIAPAKESGLFEDIIVSSEDADILRTAEASGATPLPRDRALAGDRSTLEDLLMALLPELAAKTGATDLYLLLPTSPLRHPETIRRAWEEHVRGGGGTLISVTPFHCPPQWALTIREGRLTPMFPESYDTPRLDLPPALQHDGGYYITIIEQYLKCRCLCAGETLPFYSPPHESLDIDTPEDLERARQLLEGASTRYPDNA